MVAGVATAYTDASSFEATGRAGFDPAVGGTAMALAVNTAPISFNGGQPLPYTWPHGGAGDGFALSLPDWDSGPPLPVENWWLPPPFTPAVAFARARTAVLEAGAIQLNHPHSDAQDIWREQNTNYGGEYTLRGALMTLEAILSGGPTMGTAPSPGRVYVSLHRTGFQGSNWPRVWSQTPSPLYCDLHYRLRSATTSVCLVRRVRRMRLSASLMC